jgi:hypothetical protein
MNVPGTATTPVKGIKIGTDAITFTQFSGATSTLAGAGLVATGNVFAVGAGTGITVGADAVSIDTAWAGQTAITTLGTIATGTWNATTIGTTKGGTGLTSFTSGGAVYATSTSALTTGTLPVASGGTGITSFGTGVATALGNNTGGTNGLVTFSGAMGTPTSITLTNATGLPVSTGISGLGTGVATFLATPSSANLASAVTDETGTGALVFAGSPALTGTVTFGGNAGIVNASGSGSSLFTLTSLFDKTVYNGGEFTVKLSDGTDFEIIRVLVVIKGTTFYVTQYGDVQSAGSLATVDFTLSTNNVNMTITPAAGTITAKVVGILLAA